MNTDAATRYARQIALPEIGPEGQERICGARVAVVGSDLGAETATRYLAAAGVGNLIEVRELPPDGASWLQALAGADVIVRSGFDDDAMAGAAAQLGIAVVVARARDVDVDVVSFPARPPAPEASVDVPAQAAASAGTGASAVLAGALAAAEALQLLCREPPARAIRHLRLPLDGSEPLAQEIGAR